MTAPLPVQQYAGRVRAALADLPEEQRTVLLEDLEEHLLEVAAEAPDRSLEEVLGTPEAYAAELRDAAAPAPVAAAARPRPWAGLQEGLRRAWASEAAREVRAFLPELRPAWWVLRGWLVLAPLGVLFGGGLLLPLGPVLTLPLLAAAVVVSVRLGRRSVTAPRAVRRPWLLAGNAALALMALVVLVGVQQRSQVPSYAQGPVVYSGTGGVLAREDGTPITNLFPYTTDGRPIEGVLLYDQDGRAVDNLSEYDADGRLLGEVTAPVTPPAPSNLYPRRVQVLEHDEQGRLVPVEPVPVVVPPPAATGTVETAPEQD